MGLLYVGDCSFQETENSGGINCDPWDIDTLTREWEGRKDLLENFLVSVAPTAVSMVAGGTLNLSRNRTIADKQYTKMFLTAMNVDVGRAFAKITGTFRGIQNGRKPEPRKSVSYRLQEVTLPFITDSLVINSGITGTFTYKAPTTVYTYWQQEEPKQRMFRARPAQIVNSVAIVTRTGIPGTIKFFKGQTLTNSTPNFNTLATPGVLQAYNANIECLDDEFSFEQVGQWWQVRESNVITLTPLDFLQSGYLTQA